MDVLLMALVLAVVALLIAFGWLLHRWSLARQAPTPHRFGRVCDVCGAPALPLRTHTGHDRCREHKLA